MKRFTALLIGVVVIGLLAERADAGCATFAFRRVAVVHHAYVAPYVAPVYGGYSGYYSANYDGQQSLIKEQNDLIRSQKAFIQELRLSLTNPRLGGPGEPAAGVFENFEAFAGKNCISCHQDGTAKAAETGFVMFEKDGKISPFSVPERRRMATLIEKGEMPPGNKLGLVERQQAKLLLSKK